MALLYSTFLMTTVIATGSLAVDYGRYTVARGELQGAADAAARYAASALINDLDGTNAAPYNAVISALQNKVDGVPVTCDPDLDVEVGKWNASARSFSVTTTNINAVRVTLRRTRARNNAIQFGFASILGKPSADITASATAVIGYGGGLEASYDFVIPSTSNPWLAGMPAGVWANTGNPHNNPDPSGKNQTTLKGNVGRQNEGSAASLASPTFANGVPITGGQTLSFDGMIGTATNDNDFNSRFTADGDLTWMEKNFKGAEFGKSDLVAPINSVVAVFLSDNVPTTEGAAPATLNFSTAASRDFLILAPKLRQPFYIGDGRRSGGEVQRFVVPPGATRLFIGMMDGYEWNNNVGQFKTSVHVSGSVTLVD